MLSKVLKTPIDDLMDFIKEKKEVNILTIRQKFNFPMDVIEKWLVILEEYNIIKIHYRGFEGIVNYVEKTKDKGKLSIENLKEVFIQKSRGKNLSTADMQKIWPMFILNHEEDIKVLFFESAKQRSFSLELANKAWTKYREELVNF